MRAPFLSVAGPAVWAKGKLLWWESVMYPKDSVKTQVTEQHEVRGGSCRR